MSELDELFLEFSGAEKVEDIRNLIMRNCDIESLAGFERMKRLESISLANNRIDRLDLSMPLLHLVEINVSHNKLAALGGIELLPALERLFASSNLITNITPLAKCGKISTLALHCNQIDDADAALQILKLLPKIRNLELDGNPCAEVAGYRSKFIAQLMLERFDGELVTSIDKERAELVVGVGRREISTPQRPSSAKARPLSAGSQTSRQSLPPRPQSARPASAHVGGTGMFRTAPDSEFLNTNPILLEYLAQAAQEKLDSNPTIVEDESFVEEVVSGGETTRPTARGASLTASLSTPTRKQRPATAHGTRMRRPIDAEEQEEEANPDLEFLAGKKRGFVGGLRTLTASMQRVHEMSPQEIAQLIVGAEAETSLTHVLARTARPGNFDTDSDLPNDADAGGECLDDLAQKGFTLKNLEDSYAVIRRLLKTIEVLQMSVESLSRSSEVDGRLATLEGDNRRLRAENVNMFALYEENKQLKVQLEKVELKVSDSVLLADNKRLKNRIARLEQQLKSRSASEEPEDLIASTAEYDMELAQLLKRNTDMLAQIKKDLRDTKRELKQREALTPRGDK